MSSPDGSSGTFRPMMQFISIGKVAVTGPVAAGRQDRYRVLLSDGEHMLQAMLATQLNPLVDNGSLKRMSVVMIESFAINPLAGKRLVIILGLSVVGQATDKIGTPVPFEKADQKEPGPAQAPAAPVAVPHQRDTPVQRTATTSRANVEKAPPIYPIEGLSPYQNKWTIRARVTSKSEVKMWSNSKGDGKLFNVTLMDETGEIKATGFNEVVDNLYGKLEEGKVYLISKARVNLAKKKYSSLSNEYEINFEKGTEVEECTDQTTVPEVKYAFVEFSKLEECPKDSICDIIGIVRETGICSEIIAKSTQKPVNKRELSLVDRSGYQVRLTLWGKQAENWSHEGQPIIACKGVKVGDFGGRSLSLFSSSTMVTDPDIAEAHSLRGWYDAHGNKSTFQTFSGSGGGNFAPSETRTLLDVRESGLGTSDKAEYFTARASIIHIKTDNLAYPACPGDGCQKKVVQGSDGDWRCEKCDRSFEKPLFRYLLSMSVADHTSQAWLQGFNDVGLIILGMPANELMEIKERSDDEFKDIIHKATAKTYTFSCRAKQDTFNDQTRVRYGINKSIPVDYAAEAKSLTDSICGYGFPRPSPVGAA